MSSRFPDFAWLRSLLSLAELAGRGAGTVPFGS
jgi:hypothetical protein